MKDGYVKVFENKDSADGKGANDEYNSYLYIGGLCTTEVTSENGIARDKGDAKKSAAESKGNHKQYGNVLFGDGHVEGITGTKSEVWCKKDNYFNMGPGADNDFTIDKDNDCWPTNEDSSGD